ncbi:MAG: hypothetical protein AAGG56_13225 [Pseudomonadota bacterium]
MHLSVTIDRKSFLLGSLIAVLLAGIFFRISSGFSLVAAQLPGILFAWAVFSWMYLRQTELANAGDVLPVYFTALAVYCIHFAEQFTMGFAEEMPRLYGAAAYSADEFVVYAMVCAALFVLTSLAVFLRAATFLLVPVLFFSVNSVFGSAFAQTWWSIEVGGYFPGLLTSLANWILGPVLIALLVGNFRTSAAVIVGFGVVLGLSLAFFEA